MEVTIDPAGRLLLPKSLRDALGLVPGAKVDVSPYGSGVQITPGGRTARLERGAGGRLVSRGEAPVTDAMLAALIDAGRK